MTTSVVVCDLDGTLSKYPGSDFRSLFTKAIDFSGTKNSNVVKDHLEAAKKSAELMVNRFNEVEIELLVNNVKYLHQKYGKIILLSMNFKLVAVEYIKELSLLEYFDVENSFFRENMNPGNPRKQDVWDKLLIEYPTGFICIDDDKDILEKLKKITKDIDVKFIHANEWLGQIKIEDLLNCPF